jgi:hypothetical protein
LRSYPRALRVIVCGSASPLGNDPERAQACIADHRRALPALRRRRPIFPTRSLT